jgi:uncharacterized protein (TIGR02145 family)
MKDREIQFNHGNLYFLDRLDRIIHHIRVSLNEDTSDDLTTPEAVIKFSDLEEGNKTVRLPRTTRRVVIVGNTYGNATSGDISDVRERLLSIGDQFDADNVNIYADAPIIFTPGSGSDPDPDRGEWSARLNLFPTLARIQIHAISGGGWIQNFELKGIFIDGYHRQAQIDGTLDNDHLENSRGQEANKFIDGTGHHHLTTWYSTPEINIQGKHGRAVYPTAPAATDDRPAVWGYNVFAEQPHIQVAAPVVPRIILRLTKVEVRDEADGEGKSTLLSGDWFVTFSGFYSPNKGGHISRFEAGNVYDFGNLFFDRADLSDKPNNNPREGSVVVITQQWSGNNVAIFGFRQPNPRDAWVPSGTPHTFALGPATYNGSSAGITYQWQTADKDATNITDNAVWTDVSDGTEQFLTTAPVTEEGVWFRRIAYDPSPSDRRAIYTAGARVWFSNLSAPDINTYPTAGITSVCGGMIFEISRKSDWDDTQWNAFGRDNIIIRQDSENGTGFTTPAVSRRGDNYYFTLPAPPASATDYFINFIGDINGVGVGSLTTPLRITLSPELNTIDPGITGASCFDVGHTGTGSSPGTPRPQPDFGIVHNYTLSTLGGGTVRWTHSVSDPEFADIVAYIIQEQTSPTAGIRFNSKYLTDPIYGARLGEGGVNITLTATITIAGGMCGIATYTRHHTINIRDKACCGRGGVAQPFRSERYPHHEYLTHIYMTGGRDRCWMVTNSREQPTSGVRWTQYPNQQPGLRGYYYDWAAAQTACPPGWRLPTVAEFNSGSGITGGLMQVLGTMPQNNNADNPRRFWREPTALAGYRNASGAWYHWGAWGFWWSSASGQYFLANSDGGMGFYSNDVGYGFSVRCIQNP